MIRLLFFFLSVTHSAWALNPPEVETIPREDFGHAALYYHGRQNCPSAIAHVQEYTEYVAAFPQQVLPTPQNQVTFDRTAVIRPELQDCLFAEGARVRNETFPPQTSDLLALLGPVQPDRPWLTAIGDSLEEGTAHEEAVAVLREGLIQPPSIRSVDDWAIVREFQKLFYALKVNDIPEFLLSHGEFFSPVDQRRLGFGRDRVGPARGEFYRRNLYFVDDILWGADVTLTELIAYGDQVEQSRTLEHLTVRMSRSDLALLRALPVLQKLTSLEVFFTDDPPAHNGGHVRNRHLAIRPANWSPHLPNLRRLTIRNLSRRDRTIGSQYVLNLFAGAARIEHLHLDRVPIDGEVPAILRTVKSLVLENVLPYADPAGPASPPDPESQRFRYRVFPFFQALSPELTSLSISGLSAQDRLTSFWESLLAVTPRFIDLRDLAIQIDGQRRLTFRWDQLSHRDDLWKNLTRFSFGNSGLGAESPFPQTEPLVDAANAFNAHLVRAPKLSELTLDVPVDDMSLLFLLQNTPPTLRLLRLPAARLTDHGYSYLRKRNLEFRSSSQ